MAVTSEQSAPYVAPGVFLPLIERNREKGLPNPLTAEALQRLGVSDSLVPRTIQAFKVLDLIGEDGRHTEILDSFRRLPEAEYRPAMAQWLETAYHHALDVIDPATADEIALRDAFRNYNPISMQPRMISLFTALFEAAGVRQSTPKSPTPKKLLPGLAIARSAPRSSTPRQVSERAPSTTQAASGLHPAIAGLLAGLPSPEAGWTKDDRDRFMTAFGVVLDYAYPFDVLPKRAALIAEATDADA